MYSSNIASKLLRWYRRNGRDLPWRHTRDPYKILVSEIMLQQTQVSRVVDFYDNWLMLFPNWKTLADASNAEVIRAWSGLGYNRRALILRDIAREVVQNGVPKNREGWMKLKGIGPYTAAAVSVFSARERTFPIDTNTRRVVGRIFLKQLFPDPSRDNEVHAIATKELMRSSKFDDVIQALFDLAGAHCTKTPTCDTCPLRDLCQSSATFIAGDVQAPKRMIKKANEKLHRTKPFPDRIYRGRILKAVQKSDVVPLKNLGQIIDPSFDPALDGAWLTAMVKRLEKDGMVSTNNNHVTLCSK